MVPSMWTSPVQTVMACGIISHDESRCVAILNSSSLMTSPVLVALGFVVFAPSTFLSRDPFFDRRMSNQRNSYGISAKRKRVTTSPSVAQRGVQILADAAISRLPSHASALVPVLPHFFRIALFSCLRFRKNARNSPETFYNALCCVCFAKMTRYTKTNQSPSERKIERDRASWGYYEKSGVIFRGALN